MDDIETTSPEVETFSEHFRTKTERQRIIDLIHKEHGVSVSVNDPYLIIHTLYTDLIKKVAISQEETLGRFHQDVEDVSNSWKLDSVEKAEATLTAALRASSSVIDKKIDQAARVFYQRHRYVR